MELHKFERQLRLMMLLTQNRKYTLEELGKRLDMSSRNVYRYIEAFKMAGFIVRKTNGYYSLDKASPYFKDISSLVHFTEEEALAFVHRYSRDNARTPMQWNDGLNAGFTTGTPWLPVHDDYQTENAAVEASDPASVLSWYVTLVDFRKKNEVLIDGNYTEIDASSEQVYAFLRENEDEKLLVAVNFTGENAAVDLSESGIDSTADAEILLSSYEGIDESRASAEVLRPYEAIIARVK